MSVKSQFDAEWIQDGSPWAGLTVTFEIGLGRDLSQHKDGLFALRVSVTGR